MSRFKQYALAAVLLTFVSVLSAQHPLDDIIQDDNNYAEIVARGDAYFAAKHPGKTAEELSQGEFRDGKFVKWQRWKHYWGERLNPDGTLGDPSRYFREQARRGGSSRSVGPYDNVQWTNINYTDYIVSQIGLGRTDDIAFHPTDPGTFYVAANRGGVWVTYDGGQTYAPLTDELPLLNVRSLLVDQVNPQNVYALFPEIGVYKSTDYGATWNPTTAAFPIGTGANYRTMVADPADPERIFVTGRYGTYLTTDGFASITQVNALNSYRLRFNPDDNNVVLLTTTNGKVHRSTDGGLSFTEVQQLTGNNPWLEISPQDGNYAYVGTGDQSVWRSTDGGLNWTKMADNTEGGVLMVARTNKNILFKGYFDILRSDDGGQTWTQIMDWLGAGGLASIHVDTRRLRTNPLEPDNIYVCNDGGVYRYSVSNNTFTNLSDGLVITQYYDIAVSQTDANIVGGGSQDNGNVYRQSDGSWLQYAGTGDGMNQAIDHADASYRYWEYQFGGLRRWHNGSNVNIKPSGETGAWETPYKLDPNNPQRIIAGFTSVYESTNRGDTWQNIGSNLNGGNTFNQMAIAESNSERIYVTSGNKLFVKDTNLDSWTERTLPAGSADLEVDPYNMDRVYTVQSGYTSGQKIWVSNDAGQTWENLSRNLPNVSFATIETYREIPGALFVGGDDGVWYTDSLLTEWQRYGNLPNTRTEDIEIQYAAGLIRVGTYGRGVLEAPIVVETCAPGSPDGDGDGVCDFIDRCPAFDDGLIGTPCDDGDVNSDGETYDNDCGCSGGASNFGYCAAQGSPGTGGDYIDRVRLADLDHASAQSFYSDFSDQIAQLTVGETYQVTVDFATVFGPDRAHAWIDWNRNEVFDADEHLDFSVPLASGSEYGEAYATFTVPVVASGVTTMRVRGVYSTTHLDPCGSAFGEVEDYTISVLCDDANPACRALPLAFGDFRAIALGKDRALLNWNTLAEEGVSHYTVERSPDGVTFMTLGQLPAANAAADYEYLDETAQGTVFYYRITGHDYDGATTVSPLRRVDFYATDDLAFRLFPNPVATDELTIRWRQDRPDGDVRWLVFNQWGQEVRRGKPATLAGENTATVDLAGLPAGVYLLRLRGRDFDRTGTFVRR